MKKKDKLTREEKNILKSYNLGEWKPIKNLSTEIEKSVKSARAQLESIRKEARISLRLNPIDIEMIRLKAVRVGLPYQTLLASIIHQYATDQFVRKETYEENIKKILLDALEIKEKLKPASSR